MTCECGRVLGVMCSGHGPKDEMVTVEWMPPYLRASHEAAGNRGVYPLNGAEHLACLPECGDLVVSSDPDWARIVETVAEPSRESPEGRALVAKAFGA